MPTGFAETYCSLRREPLFRRYRFPKLPFRRRWLNFRTIGPIEQDFVWRKLFPTHRSPGQSTSTKWTMEPSVGQFASTKTRSTIERSLAVARLKPDRSIAGGRELDSGQRTRRLAVPQVRAGNSVLGLPMVSTSLPGDNVAHQQRQPETHLRWDGISYCGCSTSSITALPPLSAVTTRCMGVYPLRVMSTS